MSDTSRERETETSSTSTLEQPKTLKLVRQGDGLATLWFDCPGKVNVLGRAVLDELRHLVKEIAADDSIRALIVTSAKNDTYVSGADLHEMLAFDSREAAYKMSSEGQAVFSAIEKLGKPTVFAVHGPCLGGGLESALTGTRMIATTSPQTIIGLPEVRLGLIPGLGGTQRLSRLLPVKTALELILDSTMLSAEKAHELGIVDELVDDPAKLQERAQTLAKELIAGTAKPRVPKPPEDPEKLKKLFTLMERSIKIRLKGHYPAPLLAIESIRASQMSDAEVDGGAEAKGYAIEAGHFADLAISDKARNLIQYFFTHDFISRSAARTAERTAKKKINILGIVGSGIMGTEISRLATTHGLQVRLKTSDKAKVKELTEREAAHDNIVVSADYAVLKDCDMVLEAVIEDPKVKETVLAEIEKHVSEDCVIATNTSAIELIELGQNLKHPARFIGTHFFYPVDKMLLVEVAGHPSTSGETNARALGLITGLGKTPISVKDSTGFIVNRLLTSHLMEASRLVGNGVPINWIEEAAVAFGLPMGPFTLVDELGVKLCITVAKELYESFGERFTPPKVMAESDKAGFIGKSKDNGVFLWDDNKKGDFNPKFIGLHKIVVSPEKPDSVTLQLIQDQLILPMVDEAARCLEEKVVRKARELDLAMVIGAGFPAFRGGPLRYADQTGIPQLIERLYKVYGLMPVTAADAALNSGKVRQPSEMLLSMYEQGRRFYASGEA